MTILALAFAACAGPRFPVKLDAIQREDAGPHTTFQLAAAGRVASPGTPAFENAATSLRRALIAQGLREAVRSPEVDLIVALDYGMAPPRKKRTTNNEPTLADALTVETLPYPQATLEPKEKSGRHPSRVKTSVVYKKYLVITATENAAFTGRIGPGVQVWRIEAMVENEEANLEACLPLLIRAAVGRLSEFVREQE